VRGKQHPLPQRQLGGEEGLGVVLTPPFGQGRVGKSCLRGRGGEGKSFPP